MKILLIGGTGFIGINFLKKYSSSYDITVIQRKINKLNLEKFDTVNFVECDITNSNIQKIILTENPEVVIILAGFIGLKNCQENPQKSFHTNVFGIYNILEACTKIKPKIIFLSSREVYGDSINSQSNENDNLNPKNVYGLSKMLGELLIKKVCKYNQINFIILRPTNVYGPDGSTGLNKIIKSALVDKKIIVNGGDQIINPVYVEDVTNCIHKIIQTKKLKNIVMNIGGLNSISLNQFVNHICEIITDEIEIQYIKIPDYEVTKFIPDLNQMFKILNYHPQFEINDNLKQMINSFKSKTKMSK